MAIITSSDAMKGEIYSIKHAVLLHHCKLNLEYFILRAFRAIMICVYSPITSMVGPTCVGGGVGDQTNHHCCRVPFYIGPTVTVTVVVQKGGQTLFNHMLSNKRKPILLHHHKSPLTGRVYAKRKKITRLMHCTTNTGILLRTHI